MDFRVNEMIGNWFLRATCTERSAGKQFRDPTTLPVLKLHRQQQGFSVFVGAGE